MRGERTIQLKVEARARPARSGSGARAGAEAGAQRSADEQLYQKLRGLRLELAKAQSVPPYVISTTPP